MPVTSIAGKTVETSPCFATPLDPKCRKMIAGCRSICKALDQGWVGYYSKRSELPARGRGRPIVTSMCLCGSSFCVPTPQLTLSRATPVWWIRW